MAVPTWTCSADGSCSQHDHQNRPRAAIWALPHFRCSSRPVDQGKALRFLAFVDLTHHPDREPIAGEEPAQNLLLAQRDHSSRTAPPAPKVRESPEKTATTRV